MRTASLALLLGLAFPALSQAGPFRAWNQPRVDPAVRDGRAGAAREEMLNDHLDTHGPLGIWEKDRRPKDLPVYHRMIFARIRGLLGTGALTEEQGAAFKKQHEEITALLKASADAGTEEKAEARARLDALNDAIDTQIKKKGDEGSARTPLLNWKQHRLEEAIEFGERSGRLSKGEASRSRRKLERIGDIEKRLKDEGLDTRERERLHEEANDLIAELRQELVK